MKRLGVAVLHAQDALGARTAGELAAALGTKRDARRLEEALVGLEVRVTRVPRAVSHTWFALAVTAAVDLSGSQRAHPLRGAPP